MKILFATIALLALAAALTRVPREALQVCAGAALTLAAMLALLTAQVKRASGPDYLDEWGGVVNDAPPGDGEPDTPGAVPTADERGQVVWGDARIGARG